MRLRVTLFVAGAAVIALSGCLRRFVPAPTGTRLDDVCNGELGVLRDGASTHRVGAAEIQLPRAWNTSERTATDLRATRIDGELNFWTGREFIFPAIEPRTAVRCTLQRGDTTISIQAARLAGLQYRVDVRWEPEIDGRFYYLQLQTRYAEHLKEVRGIIESVRFPVDSTSGAAAR